MKVAQSFEVARPLPAVWDLFQDVPVVAACMPGAALSDDKGGGKYAGKVSIKLGPFGASFEGEADVTADPAAHSGHAEGRAVDKKGGSRSKLVLDYRLTEIANGTRVDIDAEVQLSGPIAQFGRAGIVNETATILIAQFAKNVEERLSALPQTEMVCAQPQANGNHINAFRIFRLLFSSFFRRVLGRQG